jgi:hypothetical protein
LPELEGFLLHPIRIPIVRKRTRRRLLSSRLFSVHTPSRERTNQGRCEPGRRAVLEENKEPSDRKHCTLNRAFSQAEINSGINVIAFIFRLIDLAFLAADGWERGRIAATFTGWFFV